MNHLKLVLSKRILRFSFAFLLMLLGWTLPNVSAQCPTSNELTITVVPDPTITITGGATICEGGTITLTATSGGGTGTCTIQWQSAASGTGPWTDIPSANGTTYTTPALTTTTHYRATYSCTGGDCNTATSASQTATVVPDPSITTQPVAINQCVGGSNQLSVVATGGTPSLTYQWQSSADGTTNWTNVPSGGTSASYTPPSTTAGTTHYRVIVSASGVGCASVTSTAVPVVISPALTITAQPTNIDQCIGGTNSMTVTITGGSGTISYQWQESANGTSGWANVTGGTGGTTASYTPPSTTAGTTYYRVVINGTGNGCAAVTSTSATAIIRPALAIGTQPTNVDECIGGTNAMSVTVTGGSGTVSYQWQSSTNGTSGWTNVASGGNAASYTPPSTTAGTTYYRVIVSATGSGCTSVTSSSATAIIRPALAISTQPTNIDQCIGGTNQMSVTVTGGSGTISYQWQESANGTSGWANVTGGSGGTTASYTPSSTTAGTTYYRVIVSATGNGCAAVTSTSATAIIRPALVISTQPTNIDQCIGGTNQMSVTVTGGSGTISYQWQESANGTSGWANVTGGSGGTTASYTPPSTTAGTMYYRVIVNGTGNGCAAVTSTSATAIIRPALAISTQPTNIDQCIGGTNQMSVTVTGGSGTISYQWQSSANGTSGWANVATGGTTASYTPPSTTAGTTYYRVIVSATGSGCTSVTSSSATAIIRPALVISTQPTNIDQCIGGTNQMSVTVTGGSGTISYQWQESANGTSGWANVTGGSGGTTASYTPPSTTAGTMYYRVIVNGTGNGCAAVTSTSATAIIRPALAISTQPTNVDQCIGGTNQMSVTVTGGSGTISYQWQESANGTSGWANVTGGSGGTTASYTPPSTTAGTTYYRVVVSATGSGCTSVTSTSATAIIRPALAISTQPTNVDQCIGGTNQMSVAVTGGSGTISYQWQSSANGTSGWANVASGGNAATYTPPSTTAGTTYYRVIVSATGNGCASVTSSSATAIIREAVTITAQPTNIDECIGGTQQLSVTVTGGSGAISYQWQSSANGTSGWANVASGGNAATYTPPSTTAGTTYYRVLITAAGGGCAAVTSGSATVIIRPALAISTQPTNINQCIGGTQQLSVTVTGGSGTISYQWQSSANGTSGWANVATGGTAATYTPPSTTAGTTYYRVIVSATGNGCASVTSSSATVVIAPKPTITASVPASTICIGASVTLSSTVTGGIGTCTTQWQSSPDGTTWTDIPSAQGATYTTPALNANTRYRARVSCTGDGCCN